MAWLSSAIKCCHNRMVKYPMAAPAFPNYWGGCCCRFWWSYNRKVISIAFQYNFDTSIKNFFVVCHQNSVVRIFWGGGVLKDIVICLRLSWKVCFDTARLIMYLKLQMLIRKKKILYFCFSNQGWTKLLKKLISLLFLGLGVVFFAKSGYVKNPYQNVTFEAPKLCPMASPGHKANSQGAVWYFTT